MESIVLSTALTTTITTTATAVTESLTTTQRRKRYALPLKEEEKQKINDGQAELPIVEDNTEFHKDKIYEHLCKKGDCKSAIDTWWSSLENTQLLTASDFKAWVPTIKECSKCSNARNLKKILESMSDKIPMSVKDLKQKKTVELYEIKKKLAYERHKVT